MLPFVFPNTVAPGSTAQFASGSGAAPSITFLADTTTGISYGGSGSMVFSLGGVSTALIMNSSSGSPWISGNAGGQFVNFFSNGDLGLTPHAGNKLYLGIGTSFFGAADVAAPVAQTIGVQSVVAGTTNTAGAVTTFRNSAGTGTGVGGNIVFQYAPHGSTGTAQNTFATALTINGDTGGVTLGGATLAANGVLALKSLLNNSTALAIANVSNNGSFNLGHDGGGAAALSMADNGNNTNVSITANTTITSYIKGVFNTAAGTATPAGGSTSAVLLFGTTSGFGVYYGSGAPTVTAGQGSIYLRSDGSSTSTRLYVNTTGSTTWTNFTSAT